MKENKKTFGERMKRSTAVPFVAAALLAGVGAGITGIASAQTASSTTSATAPTTQPQGQGMRPGVMGTIASISGTTITITGANGTTYTVDASGATFQKNSGTQGTAPSTIALSDLAVGDKVGVRGTVTGTSVVATEVMDGVIDRGPGGGHGRGPGVQGTVSAVNGNTVTITNSDGTTYTIDASSAQVSKMVDLSVSDIKVGDQVGVQGTVSGTSVSATRIMDGIPAAPAAQSTSASTATGATAQ